MYGERHDFTLRLELLTDLHLGSGEREAMPTRRTAAEAPVELDASAAEPMFDAIARDVNGKPWLPPTSLKGAMRELCDEASKALIFGTRPDDGDPAGGRLYVWSGAWKEGPPAKPDGSVAAAMLPLWDDARQTYIGAHVAIDPQTGAGEKHRLMFREYVPQGTVFEFSACWLGSIGEFETHIVPLINRMAGPYGLALGKATRAGFGRVRVHSDEPLDVRSTTLTLQDDLPLIDEVDRKFVLSPAAAGEVDELVLHCSGPFLIADPQRDPSNDHVDTRTLQRDASAPELLGTSLMGCLRSRAGWLQQTELLLEPDNRNAKLRGRPELLSPVQRVFGVNGWAKQIRVLAITLEHCGSEQHVYPGIKLDDFTQGGIGGAVFLIEAPADVTFRITYALEKRCWTRSDTELFEALLRDLADNGLKIGHSTGVGFGWFECVGDAKEEVDA